MLNIGANTIKFPLTILTYIPSFIYSNTYLIVFLKCLLDILLKDGLLNT